MVLASLGSLALGTLGTLGVRHSPQQATVFAERYDEANFRSIAVGAPTSEVRERLGAPVSESSGPQLDYLHYSAPVASAAHMVRRTLAVDPGTQRVVEIDDRVVFDYLAHWASGGLRKR